MDIVKDSKFKGSGRSKKLEAMNEDKLAKKVYWMKLDIGDHRDPQGKDDEKIFANNI